MSDARWQQRDQATATEERIDTRMMSLRVATANDADRSVEAVLSSDQPVEMWDWRSGEMIDEVLLGDAVDLPRQMPLLAIHSRWSLDDVLGSVRSIRSESGDDGASLLVGRLIFATEDEAADRAWNKVRNGHITDVSIGYRVLESTEIARGQTAKVAGREFKAANRRLRIATKWIMREASVVPIGADQKAKTRSDNSTLEGDVQMDKTLREYLESIGLRAEATDEEAWNFLAGLQGEQRDAARDAMLGVEQRSDDQDDHDQDGDDDRQDEPTADQVRDEERQRVVQIRELAGSDVPQATVDEAIRDGWDMARASSEFLQAVRGQRMRQTQTAPAGQSTDRGSRVSVRSLAAGMLISGGYDPTGMQIHDGRRLQRTERLSERDADLGDEFTRMSAIEIVRECARMDNGGRLFHDPEEAIRAAISGTSLDRVFTTNIYASMMAGWEETPDTTEWCQVEDVPNFMSQEDITLRANSNLDRHPRGATAKHATAEDDYETYKAYRFSKQFVVDEQDLINDRLGALMQMPREMGQAARRVRPDLVYATLLANGALTATAGALFNSTAETTSGGHANLGSTALGSAGLKAAITGMAAHRLNPNDEAVPLNIRPRWLIVPPDLEWTARELLSAGEIRNTTASTIYPTINVLRDVGLSLIVESRIDASGCTHPVTGTAYTGSATIYLLAAARRTVKVAYVRGTGRVPTIRRSNLTQGQWGIGWDVKLDVGASAVDYRGLYKGNS